MLIKINKKTKQNKAISTVMEHYKVKNITMQQWDDQAIEGIKMRTGGIQEKKYQNNTEMTKLKEV
jgi:hypothetical protein